MVPKSWQEHVIANIVSPMRLSDEHNMGAKLVGYGPDGDLDVLSIGWSHHRLCFNLQRLLELIGSYKSVPRCYVSRIPGD